MMDTALQDSAMTAVRNMRLGGIAAHALLFGSLILVAHWVLSAVGYAQDPSQAAELAGPDVTSILAPVGTLTSPVLLIWMLVVRPLQEAKDQVMKLGDRWLSLQERAMDLQERSLRDQGRD